MSRSVQTSSLQGGECQPYSVGLEGSNKKCQLGFVYKSIYTVLQVKQPPLKQRHPGEDMQRKRDSVKGMRGALRVNTNV